MNNCPQSKQNHAELVLANPNVILVYQISSTCTRVLVDVREKITADTKEYLAEVIYPQMPGELISLSSYDVDSVEYFCNNPFV